MKAKLIPFLLIASGALFATRAHAVSGVINFTGEVKTNTCKINAANDGSANISVTLPPVSAGALSVSGATAGYTRFAVNLTDCHKNSSSSAYVYFEPRANADPVTGHLKLDTTSSAGAVQISILDANDKAIPLSSPAQNATPVPIAADGTATLNFATQYVATARAQGGTASAQVYFTIVYQ